ncbi:MAG: hypothetical protein PHO41_09460, partial [Eubacteriales bacterium]|nr:hypothetical protein [Eubacteriales bacterium]
MIRCFRSSKWIVAIGTALSLALCAVVISTRPNTAIWLNLITCVLILALGFVVSTLTANMAASNANAKLLGILHVELDPERFISTYSSIPGKLPASSHLRTVTSSYLAAGYAAKGEYALAKQTLFIDPLPTRNAKNDLAVQALIHDTLCELALLSGDAEQGSQELSSLREVLQKAAVLNRDLARNYRNTVVLYEQWLLVLAGEAADDKALSEVLSHTPIKLRRLEIQMLLADAYARRKQNGLAKDTYQAVIQEA